MKKPRAICSVLDETLKGLEISVPLRAYSVLGAWKELVGEPVSVQTRPRLIRNRVLIVDVSHPAWMHHLQFLKPAILNKLNGFIGGKPLIDDIRFRVAPIPPKSASLPSQGDWRNEKLSNEVLGRIRSASLHVYDRDLGQSLEDLLIKGAKLEQYRKKKGR